MEPSPPPAGVAMPVRASRPQRKPRMPAPATGHGRIPSMTAADPALLDEAVDPRPRRRRADPALVPPAGPGDRPQGRRDARDRRRPGRRAAPAARDRPPPPRRRHRGRGGGRPGRAPAGAAGSSTPSTAPRRSPAASRCTRPCWPSTTAKGPAVGVINLPALGQTVYAGRGLGCFEDGAPVQREHHGRAAPGLRDVVGLQPLGPRCAPAAQGQRRRPADLGRRLRLRAGGHRPGRGDDRPGRLAVGPRPHAGDPDRGRRPVLDVGRHAATPPAAPAWPATV